MKLILRGGWQIWKPFHVNEKCTRIVVLIKVSNEVTSRQNNFETLEIRT